MAGIIFEAECAECGRAQKVDISIDGNNILRAKFRPCFGCIRVYLGKIREEVRLAMDQVEKKQEAEEADGI